MQPSIDTVKEFWGKNPLFAGESRFAPGTQEFFKEHRRVYIEDCFAGVADGRLFPRKNLGGGVLDLGCGPGFWCIELAHAGVKKIIAADLTFAALTLTKKRAAYEGATVPCSQQNAEQLGFADASFAHVNCQGVIHHTPNTAACVREISRVLVPGGTAVIAVYYWNLFLRLWPLLRKLRGLMQAAGVKMPGRGREAIYKTKEVAEIVRLFDGADNPLGKAFTRSQFLKMLGPYFDIRDVFYHFFPARSLPMPIPKMFHRFLDKHAGFLMFVTVTKKAR
ncbi:MAG: class I SAM-dependent methyltransferase [Chitinivibrionales bacterium]|nr:class I SAM-dependent methyltransferase [Chitinivibrionales bacterium]